MKQEKKIIIIEDHDIVIWALTAIINGNIENPVISSAYTFENGITLLKEGRVDLIILDIDLPGGNNPKMISQLRHVQPQVPIMIHTGLLEEDYSHKYFIAGADGFLSKNDPFDKILEAITTLLDGKKYISLTSKNILAENYLKNPTKKNRYEYNTVLTLREKEIARLLIEGKWTKEIADQLGIKLSTVSTHKLHIFEKFEVTTVVELYRKIEKEMPELLKSDAC